MSDVALRNTAVDAVATDLDTNAWYAIGSDATTQASNERLQPTYPAAAASSTDLSATLSFTGTASAAVSHLLVYDAQTLGTLRFAVALSGDLAFNAAGDLNLTSAAVTVADA